MTAERCIRDGKPREALAILQEQVRREPANPKLRTFLFQLLCVLGEWERALRQLEVVGEMDPGTLAMVSAYREAVRCESLRQAVTAGRNSPLVFGEPEEWIAFFAQALQHDAAQQPASARELRQRALAEAPACSGAITVAGGTPQQFSWLADADGRLGPILEALVNGRYYWVPVHRMRSVRIEAPTDLRDMVWLPAQITWSNGGESAALIPTRYVGSEAVDNGSIQLARRTEWRQVDSDTWFGLGQRMLTSDIGDFPLLDVRDITFDAVVAGGSS